MKQKLIDVKKPKIILTALATITLIGSSGWVITRNYQHNIEIQKKQQKTKNKKTPKKTKKTLGIQIDAINDYVKELPIFEQISVPDFVNKNKSNTRNIAGHLNLTLQFVNSNNEPVDIDTTSDFTVLSQSVLPEEVVTRVTPIVLTIETQEEKEAKLEQERKEKEQERKAKEQEEKRIQASQEHSEEKEEFLKRYQALNKTPTYDELKQLALDKYGMDEESFILCLGWLAGDNLQGQDDYASYLSGCTGINAYLKQGADAFKKFYTSWGSYYSMSNYQTRATQANDYVRRIFWLCLEQRDSRATEANGMCIENGYNAHSIDKAFYKVRYKSAHILPTGSYDGWFGVWQY